MHKERKLSKGLLCMNFHMGANRSGNCSSLQTTSGHDFWKTLSALPQSDMFILCRFTNPQLCYLCLQPSCRTTWKTQAQEQPNNLRSAEHERLGSICNAGHPAQKEQAGIFAHHSNEKLKSPPSRAGGELWLFSALPTTHSWQLRLWMPKCLPSVKWSDNALLHRVHFNGMKPSPLLANA